MIKVFIQITQKYRWKHMAISLSDDQVRLLQMRAQRLIPQQADAITNVAHVVKELCGLQAQDAFAAMLAVRVRSTGLAAADIENARVQERSVVRTWGMRGTLHLLAKDDLSWLLPLLGPVFVAGGRRRRAELGLDEDIYARGIRINRNVLTNHGPLTRDELVEQLATHGIRRQRQARPYFMHRGALGGIICLGPDRGAEPPSVLLSERVYLRHNLSQEAAHAELAR